MDRNLGKYEIKIDNFLKQGVIFKDKCLKIRKKANVWKSVAQIGSGILLILSHAGLTATTDSALVYLPEPVYSFSQYSL